MKKITRNRLIYKSSPIGGSSYFPGLFSRIIKVVEPEGQAIQKAIDWVKDNVPMTDSVTINIDSGTGDISIYSTEEINPQEKSDIQKFIDLYLEMGIVLVPVINTDNDYGYQYLELKVPDVAEERTGDVIGYSNFRTAIYFDKNGNFQAQGIWE